MSKRALELCRSLLTDQARATIEHAVDHREGAQVAVHSLCAAPEFANLVCQLTSLEVHGVCCDQSECMLMKGRGALAFSEQDYAAAASEYTSALRNNKEGTREGSKLAAVLYANRAACMLRMRRFKQAVHDAECAIDVDPLYGKARYRYACALRDLGRKDEALNAALEALNRLPRGSKEAEEINDLIMALRAASDMETPKQNLYANVEPKDNDDRVVNSCPVVTLGDCIKTRAPQLSVTEIKGSGRGLVVCANEGLRPGDLALTDEALATILHRSRRETHCSMCLAPLPVSAAVVTGFGRFPLLCSLACKRKMIASHPLELGKTWACILPDEALLAFRLATLPPHFAALSQHLDAQFASIGVDHRIDTVVLATITAACWQACAGGTLLRDLTEKTAAIWHALHVIDTNSFAIVGDVRGGDAENWRIGRGVYPVASLVNHSCRPSLCVSFRGTTLVARSVGRLAHGTQVTHCYGPQEGAQPLGIRRKLLLEQYLFKCYCDACAHDELSQISCETFGMRCAHSKCRGWVCLTREGCMHASTSPVCNACNQQVTSDALQRGKEAVVSSNKVCEEAYAMIQTDTAAALRLLGKWLQSHGLRLHKAHEAKGMVQHAAASALYCLGRNMEAARLAESSLACLEFRYSPDSIIVAHERAYCAALYALALSPRLAARIACKTARTIRHSYGVGHPLERALHSLIHLVFHSPQSIKAAGEAIMNIVSQES